MATAATENASEDGMVHSCLEKSARLQRSGVMSHAQPNFFFFFTTENETVHALSFFFFFLRNSTGFPFGFPATTIYSGNSDLEVFISIIELENISFVTIYRDKVSFRVEISSL